ncbi:uncharacterized protein N7498_010142 [Penicillium cinerascens]|uniref:Uncharacterized protein n=1 Tax=Penicillium cinerascens TaxID=70096 RepID=A0A9W9J7U8_9EURO|nr:uncharacterized protein N7498_010142 [Penicillium cinerascens]KAJ5191157.1 hypothetical protein N7498_010142 [Penicillium cinerascens]
MPHHHADMVMRHTLLPREVVPSHRIPFLVPTASQNLNMPSLVARAPASSETGSSGGEKPTSSMTTTVLPVVLGAGVPILCAIVVLIFLHRRHVKRLLREDANDKHKSLDFGMDVVGPSGGRKKKGMPNGLPQMMEPSHTKGMSLDVHPYLLPPGLHRSRDSLHSLSRSIDDDKYLPATFITNDNGSVRSFPRGRDDASSFTGSTSRFGVEEPNSGLLRNAQRMSRSSPPLYPSPSNESTPQPPPTHQNYLGPLPGSTPSPSEHDERGLAIGSATTDAKSSERAAPSELHFNLNSENSLHFEIESPLDGTGNENTYHEERLNFPLPEAAPFHEETHHEQSSTMQLPRISLPASDVTSSDYGDERKSELMIPAVNVHSIEDGEHDASSDNKPPDLPEESPNPALGYDNRRDTRRLTLGVRPLPPDDPADNPEQRANRIRSFYKEYFDDSKRETTYYEDYGSDFYDGGYVYDPVSGDYYDAAPPVPFAEPVGRRAMTPPPRAPPRFQGAARHMATNSAGFNGFTPGPRAFSSASGRLPGPRGPRKPMPPPAPLQLLPTPHMLKDDSIMMATDFAPGMNVRDRRGGRPETPTGGMHPFSPGLRAHTPLASAFDELAVIPSPHALRKSGTYTSLDFAPPPRFKNSDTGSDAGSIRSNRTGISNTHMNNIRMGNYRISRLPADTVGTKDDLMASLRPNWGMQR